MIQPVEITTKALRVVSLIDPQGTFRNVIFNHFHYVEFFLNKKEFYLEDINNK